MAAKKKKIKQINMKVEKGVGGVGGKTWEASLYFRRQFMTPKLFQKHLFH